MPDRDRPRVIVVHKDRDHGCVITVILVIIAWPLAIVYWVLRVIGWSVGSAIDWLTAGPWRRRR
ncbi:MAG: hypothetical protein ACXWM8_06920 [Candidatus Limnocylindrales bacterium]